MTNSFKDGIKTNDGTLHQVDTILFATGFDLEMSARPFDLVGLSGHPTNIALKANFGITHPEYPNAFVLLGFKSLFLDAKLFRRLSHRSPRIRGYFDFILFFLEKIC